MLVVAYVAGYFVLGPEVDDSFPGIDRAFETKWQARAYIPAAFIEAKVTGTSVSLLTGHYNGRDYDSYVEIERLNP